MEWLHIKFVKCFTQGCFAIPILQFTCSPYLCHNKFVHEWVDLLRQSGIKNYFHKFIQKFIMGHTTLFIVGNVVESANVVPVEVKAVLWAGELPMRCRWRWCGTVAKKLLRAILLTGEAVSAWLGTRRGWFLWNQNRYDSPISTKQASINETPNMLIQLISLSNTFQEAPPVPVVRPVLAVCDYGAEVSCM